MDLFKEIAQAIRPTKPTIEEVVDGVYENLSDESWQLITVEIRDWQIDCTLDLYSNFDEVPYVMMTGFELVVLAVDGNPEPGYDAEQIRELINDKLIKDFIFMRDIEETIKMLCRQQ